MWSRILSGTTLSILLIVGFLEAYARQSDSWKMGTPEFAEDATSLVLLFHGSEDYYNPAWRDIRQTLSLQLPKSEVVYYDWRSGSDNRLRAASNGRALGRVLGDLLGQNPALQDIKLIAHSAGAAVLEPLCSALRAKKHQKVRIEMVFLDPYGGQGFFDRGYGARAYGGCADFAVNYFNTSDHAPSTNDPLDKAFNIDVTAIPGKELVSQGAHFWPLHYFLEAMRSKQTLLLDCSTHDFFPRGDVVNIQPNCPS